MIREPVKPYEAKQLRNFIPVDPTSRNPHYCKTSNSVWLALETNSLAGIVGIRTQVHLVAVPPARMAVVKFSGLA